MGDWKVLYNTLAYHCGLIFEKKESEMGKMYTYILVVSIIAISAIIIASFIVPSETELIAKGISPTARYSRLAWVVAGSAVFFLPVGIFSSDCDL